MGLRNGVFSKNQAQIIFPLLINAARGSIVDTDALVAALRDGTLSGAGLDVVEDEDGLIGTDHPLRSMDNVVLTPHSAWFSPLFNFTKNFPEVGASSSMVLSSPKVG